MKSVREFVRIFYKKTKTFLQNLLDYEIILLPLCRYLHANASFMKTEMITLKKVSLKDIAAKAGVSTALVSFVLNGKGQEHRIGEETARHILQIAKEMNYRPNLAARGLRSGTTGTLGVVVSDISNPFFAQIARDIEDAADKLGRTVFFGSSDESAEKMKTLIEGLKGKLRGKLDALPPKARLGMVLTAFAAFAVLCLYMTATAIIGFGKGSREMEIRHIEKLDLPMQDSMNLYNNVYGKGTEEE